MFKKRQRYQIVTCVLRVLTGKKYQGVYGNNYRKFTNLLQHLTNILRVVKPVVYYESLLL